ncbi:MAG: ABC transporter substrate-binding protein [Coriobacteriia bacterium]|nr:ABC transporter substrate-binding protein [Coriobacteriia bacterium]
MRRTSRFLTAAVLAAAVAAGAAACSREGTADGRGEREAEAAAFPVTVTDDAGREVTIASEPRTIVSLAPANTEIVAALGLLERLGGVTTFDDYPPEVLDLPKVGDFVAPNIEAVAAAGPDLVLVTGGVQADVIEKLEGVGAAVVTVDPQTLEGLYASIGMVGRVTGRSVEASSVVGGIRADLEGITAAIGDADDVPVFIEIAQNPLFTVGSGTLMDDLIAAAGGRNVVTQPGYVPYSVEQLVDDDPAVYLATKGSMSDPSQLEGRPGYDKLRAVRGGRVAVLDDNLVSRPGPRVVLGVRAIAEALHPGAFGK